MEDKNQIIETVKTICKKHFVSNDYDVFLFGSRAKGDFQSRSDFDIGILGKSDVSPEVLFHIREDIEKIPSLYTIDIVDFSDVSEKFKKEAFQNIEYVIQRS